MPFKTYYNAIKKRPAYIIINTLSALTCGIALIVGGLALNKARDTSKTAKDVAIQSHNLAVQNHKLVIRIQNQRRDLTYKNCRDQNARHKAGLVALNKLLIGTITSHSRRKDAFKITKPLIDALVPHRNCLKVANSVKLKPQPQKKT